MWSSVPVRSVLRDRYLLFPALAIAALAVGADVAQWLRAAPFWVDEEMIALNIRDRTFSELPGPLWLGQAAPLGWLFLQRAAMLALGTSELALRFVPLLFGAATIVAALWVGARWLHWVSAAAFVLLMWIGQWMSHYRFELKHYSADTFFALLLPALGAWVTEAAGLEQARWRWTRWWIVAALGQWLAYGAVLVTPACALLLGGVLFRRYGLRPAIHFSAVGVVWLLSFGAHYALSMQYTHRSTHLREYWAGYVVPDSAAAAETVSWIVERLDDLARNPGGTTVALALWIAVASGFVLSHRRVLAAMFAVVPLSAFVLAASRLVPLTDRLALWIVPALYLGVAMLLDAGVRISARGLTAGRLPRIALGTLALLAAAYVGGDIAAEGRRNLDVGVPGDSNHALDDRGAVAWLMERRRPGDAILTTPLGSPALRWYGGISLRRHPGGRLPDGSLMLEVTYEAPSPCRDRLQDALGGRRRVLVYVGFPDMQDGFYELLLHELTRFGRVVESATFSQISRTAVLELQSPANVENGGVPPLEGCVDLRTARRW